MVALVETDSESACFAFSLVLKPIYTRMYINILLDTVLATDVNKYSLASARCQPIWRTHLANWIYF